MAATTTVINSTDWIVQVTEDSGSSYDTIGKCTSVDINFSMATRDVTTKDSSGWREILSGKMEWNVNFEALVLFDASSDVDRPNDVFSLASARTEVGLRVGKIQTGDYVYTGDGYFVNFGISGGVEDNVTNSIGFEGTSTLTQAAYA